MQRTKLTIAMFVLMLVLAALDQTILSTALPAIVRELKGADRLSWVFSAYLISSTVVIPLYGKLADVYGSRPTLLAAVALFLLGSLACGFSASMDQLIAARGLQGLGGGGLLTLTMLGVADLFPPAVYPPEQRGKVQALLGASFGISTMFGPLTGGYLVEHLSWHWAFFINVPAALLALVVLWIVFRPGPARHPQKVDYAGAVLLGAALICALLATRHEAGAVATNVLPLTVAAIVLALSFLMVQRRVAQPLVPLSLFGAAPFSAATVISLLSGVALFAAVVFLPTYLQTGLRLTPSGSAWHLLPLMAGLTVSAVTSGKLLRRSGKVRLFAQVACMLMALAFASLVAVLHWWPHEPLALSACVLPLGMGLGLLFPLVTMVSQLTSPPQMLGIATATPIMVRSLGGAIGVSLLASLLTHEISGHLAEIAVNAGAAARAAAGATSPQAAMATVMADAMAAGLQPMYAVAASLCLLAAVATAWLPARLVRPAGPAGAGAAGATPTATAPAQA